MPFFIALGDEIRLTIVEVLTEAASKNCSGDFPGKYEPARPECEGNHRVYKPLKACCLPPSENFKRGWTYRYQALGDLQLLLSHNLRGHS